MKKTLTIPYLLFVSAAMGSLVALSPAKSAEAAAGSNAEPEIPWATIKDAAAKYLDVCVVQPDRDSMARKMKSRIDQRVEDTGVSREDAAREIMFDWAASNQKNLKQKEPRAVAQVCFYFVMFMDNQFLISSQIRKSLTPSLVEKIVEFLREEVKKKEKA